MTLNESRYVNIQATTSSATPSVISCAPPNGTMRALVKAGQKGLEPAIGLSDRLRRRILKGYGSEINGQAFIPDKQRPGRKGSTVRQSAERPLSALPSDSPDTGFTVPLSSIETKIGKGCKTSVYVPASQYDPPRRTLSRMEYLHPDITLCQNSSCLHTDRSCPLLSPSTVNDPADVEGANILTPKPTPAFDARSVDKFPTGIGANAPGPRAPVIDLNRVFGGDKALTLDLLYAHLRMMETPDQLFDQYINVPDGDDGEWGLDCPEP